MAKRNMKKIIIGIVLIVIGLGTIGVAGFYQFVVKPELDQREASARAQAQWSKKAAQAKPNLQPQEPVKVSSSIQSAPAAQSAPPPQPVQKIPPVAETKAPPPPSKVYGEAEEKNKEGLLWFDSASSKYVITLGTVQGLTAGSALTVYDGNNRIGQVIVQSAADINSYVQPSPDTQLTGNYYRVVIE